MTPKEFLNDVVRPNVVAVMVLSPVSRLRWLVGMPMAD